jgi:hypothetical protein
VLLSSHPGVAALTVPEGKHVGVDLFGGGHVCPPAGRVRTLRYCRTDRKRRRGDAISTGIPPVCPTYLMLRRDVCCGSIASF